MRLHLLGIPHTVTTKAFAHCAFTQKVYKFSRMMVPLGYEVIHYGVEGSDSGASEDVVVMGQEEHQRLLGHPYNHDKTAFYGNDAQADSEVYRQWRLLEVSYTAMPMNGACQSDFTPQGADVAPPKTMIII